MDPQQSVSATNKQSSAAARDINARLAAVTLALMNLNDRNRSLRRQYAKSEKECQRLERLTDRHTSCRQQMLWLVGEIELALATARKDIREMEERIEVINHHRRPRLHRNYERRYLLRSIAETNKSIKDQAELLKYKKKYISSFCEEVEAATMKARADKAQAAAELAVNKRFRKLLIARRRRLLKLKRGLQKNPG